MCSTETLEVTRERGERGDETLKEINVDHGIRDEDRGWMDGWMRNKSNDNNGGNNNNSNNQNNSHKSASL